MPAFFTYKVRCANAQTGEVYHSEVRAMETDTPGIILTSGKFGMTTDVFGLLAVAKALGKVANWRRHAKNVCTAKLGADIRKVLSQAEFEWVETTTSEAAKKASLRAVGMA